jgi:hypothetical protein
MKWKPSGMNEWMNGVRGWTELKYAARGTEQPNCDKPAEWHTRSPLHEPIETSCDSYDTVVGNFFCIV